MLRTFTGQRPEMLLNKYPAKHDNYPAQNVNSAAAEKPCSRRTEEKTITMALVLLPDSRPYPSQMHVIPTRYNSPWRALLPPVYK